MPEEGQPEYEPGLLYFSDVYHISFFLIINIVLLNVVFGIILDTFAELRGEKARADSATTHARPFSAKPRGNLARVGGHQYALGVETAPISCAIQAQSLDSEKLADPCGERTPRISFQGEKIVWC